MSIRKKLIIKILAYILAILEIKTINGLKIGIKNLSPIKRELLEIQYNVYFVLMDIICIYDINMEVMAEQNKIIKVVDKMSKRTRILGKLKHCYLHKAKYVLDMKNEDLEIIIKALEKQNWVSVKDKLPPKPEFSEKGYIIQTANVIEPYSAYWDGNIWIDTDCTIIDNVIAWMPLPEQYKPGGKTNE